ncbi:MAG: hypothetical protein OEM24_09570 [Paracoccaceae bacterium]|nr:hypothetical protein [Paracoccaceae bacterium]
MAAPTDIPAPAGLSGIARSAPLHLLGTGSLLAVTVLVSKLAAEAGAQMLWFLALVFLGAGAALTLTAAAAGRLRLSRPIVA